MSKKNLKFVAAICAAFFLAACNTVDQQPKRIATKPAAPETITVLNYFKGLNVAVTVTISAMVGKGDKSLVLYFIPIHDDRNPKAATIPIQWLKSETADVTLEFQPGQFKHTVYRYNFPTEWAETNNPLFNIGSQIGKDDTPCLSWLGDRRNCLTPVSTAGQGSLKKLVEGRRVELVENLPPFNGGKVMITDSSGKDETVSGTFPFKKPRSVNVAGKQYQLPIFNKLVLPNPGRMTRGFTLEFKGHKESGGNDFVVQIPPGAETIKGAFVINLLVDKACHPAVQVMSPSGFDYLIERSDPSVSFMGQPYCKGSNKR